MDEIEDTNYKFNSKEIENIWDIFMCLSDSTFSSVDISYGKKGPYVLSGQTMMSICNTLETIDFCCYRNAYSDAYTLIRKTRDDLMQYLFVLNVIQNKHGLTDEEIEEFTLDVESMMKMIELNLSILFSGERKTDIELAMEKWIYNVLASTENNKDRKQFFGTSKYKSWENNLFNFFTKVTPKLTEDLKKPFKLEGGVQRIDDTPVHKAVREGFVNMIIHADYLMDAGVLKVIKRADSFEFTNPGILKLPLEDIYRGGNSKSRNPHMQTMLRLVGFGDNAGSGFPTILDVWKSEGWVEPQLIEDTNLNQVTLVMKMERVSDENVIEISEEKIKQLIPEYSKKKLTKACEILKMISKNPNISIDELRVALDVTDRTIARYISELKNKGIIERKGPDNGGEWKIL